MRFKLCPAAPRARVACCTLLPPYHPHPLASFWESETRRQNVLPYSALAGNTHIKLFKFFTALHMSINDRESAMNVFQKLLDSLMAQMVKSLPTVWEI